MPIATNLIVTTKNGNKTKTTNITYANPEAADSSLATFAASLFSLSNNELVGIDRVNKTGLEIPAVQPAGKASPNLSVDVDSITIETNSKGNSWVNVPVTINVTRSGNGVITANSSAEFTGYAALTITVDGTSVSVEPTDSDPNVFFTDTGGSEVSGSITINVAETDDYASATVTVPVTVVYNS